MAPNLSFISVLCGMKEAKSFRDFRANSEKFSVPTFEPSKIYHSHVYSESFAPALRLLISLEAAVPLQSLCKSLGQEIH